MNLKIPLLFKIVPILIVYWIRFVNSVNQYQYGTGELVFAQILFRHGDRTPLDPYPNDPYGKRSFWPVGFGQLTNTGKMQEYRLGQWLRQRYDKLLTEHYDPNIVQVRSTDVDRTLMSAASNLAAMFPPNSDQRWNPSLDWQPIPIHTEPEQLDKILAAKFPCPAYEQEEERLWHSAEIQELNKRFADVYRVLNANTGRNVTTITEIEYVHNTLFIETLYNYTLPAWTKSVYPYPMEEAAKYSFALPTWTPKMARLRAGLLVKELINNMKYKKDNVAGAIHNVWIYSAHDTTVANLLNALRVFDLQLPPYSATVLLELWRDSNGDHSVALLYRNLTEREPYQLTVPGCSVMCPLDQFIRYCAPLIPDDWDEECRTSLFTTTSFSSTLTVTGLAIVFVLICLLAWATTLYYQHRRRPTHWYRKLKTDNL